MSDYATTTFRTQRVRELGELTMRSVRRGGTHTLALIGELDVANSADVEAELLLIEGTDARRIVLDLSKLEFTGTSGIRLLVAADARSRADSNRLVLTRPPQNVHRALTIAGVVDRLPFEDRR